MTDKLLSPERLAAIETRKNFMLEAPKACGCRVEDEVHIELCKWHLVIAIHSRYDIPALLAHIEAVQQRVDELEHTEYCPLCNEPMDEHILATKQKCSVCHTQFIPCVIDICLECNGTKKVITPNPEKKEHFDKHPSYVYKPCPICVESENKESSQPDPSAGAEEVCPECKGEKVYRTAHKLNNRHVHVCRSCDGSGVKK